MPLPRRFIETARHVGINRQLYYNSLLGLMCLCSTVGARVFYHTLLQSIILYYSLSYFITIYHTSLQSIILYYSLSNNRDRLTGNLHNQEHLSLKSCISRKRPNLVFSYHKWKRICSASLVAWEKTERHHKTSGFINTACIVPRMERKCFSIKS